MIYSNLITIPSICPLRFKDPQLHNEAAIYPSAFSYVQKWTPSDTIHVQLLATTDMSTKVTLDLVDYDTENPFLISGTQASYSATWVELSAGKWYGNYYIPCFNLNGTLYASMNHTDLDTPSNSLGTLNTSMPFLIGDINGFLLSYYHSKNDFNTVFGTYSALNQFSIRIEGGFPPDGRKDNSQFSTFTDHYAQGRYMDSMPSVWYKLVFGDANGLSGWMEELLYNIMCCDTIIVNGMQYVREGEFTESVTEKKTKQLSMYLSPYTNRFTQTLDGEIIITDGNDVPLANELIETLVL